MQCTGMFNLQSDLLQSDLFMQCYLL